VNIDLIALLQSVLGISAYLPGPMILFGICAVVAAQLPPPGSPASLYGVAWRLVNFLGQNYRFAANAAPPAASAPGMPPAAAAVILLLCIGATLSACGNPATVAGVEVALTAAEQAATAYVKLPACPAAALCSSPAISVDIKAADTLAYTAVKGAEAGTVTPAAALAAVQQLSALIPAAAIPAAPASK
jgi:hypothetical protein